MDKQLKVNTTRDRHKWLKGFCNDHEITVQATVNQLITVLQNDDVLQDQVVKQVYEVGDE